MPWTLEGNPLGSILVSRLRYLGDVVMSTVVLEVLKKGDPELDIGYLCEAEAAPVLAGHPDLNRVHSLVSKRTGNDARTRQGTSAGDGLGQTEVRARGALGMMAELRRTRYDLAVDLFFNPRSAWLLRLAGIPRRIGGTRSSRRHLYNYSIFRNEVEDECPGFGRVAPGGLGEHLCRFAPLVHQPSGLCFADWLVQNYRPGALRPRLARRQMGSQTQKLLFKTGIPVGDPYLLLIPGATWPSKEWPLSHWEQLALELGGRTGQNILVLSPPGPGRAWSTLDQAIPSGRGGVLPVLDLAEVLEVVTQASLVIAADGGIMHAAVGLGRPTVGLFGPTSPEIWFPYEVAGPFRVLCTRPVCHPCNLHDCPEFICLPQLKPETVLAAVDHVRELDSEPDRRTGGSSEQSVF